MAKPASRPRVPLEPEEPGGDAFLEIEAKELEEARRDPVVRQFAEDADGALREAERRGEISSPD
jgi:hypothetical protein